MPRDKGSWVPAYPVTFSGAQGGEREIMVEVAEAATTECPVSIVSRHPEMEVMVLEILHSDRVHEFSGGIAFGSNTSKWPARWHEAVLLAEIEKRRLEAEIEKMSRRVSLQ